LYGTYLSLITKSQGKKKITHIHDSISEMVFKGPYNIKKGDTIVGKIA
jgi:hypothetical protein